MSTQPREATRTAGDFTLGCGQPPAGVINGRVCAGTGAQLSCQLCPSSPSYWRHPEPPSTVETPMRDRGPMLAAAYALAAEGWPVFVLGRTKRPVANCPACRERRTPTTTRPRCDCLTCHGFYAATTDPDRIAAMLRRRARRAAGHPHRPRRPGWPWSTSTRATAASSTTT